MVNDMYSHPLGKGLRRRVSEPEHFLKVWSAASCIWSSIDETLCHLSIAVCVSKPSLLWRCFTTCHKSFVIQHAYNLWSNVLSVSQSLK